MATKEEKYTSWEMIQKLYPDSFVLLENPVYDPMRSLKGAIFVYKNKNRKKVFEKATKLALPYITIKYTGGIRGDRVNENVLIL
jgi:hypothetical protein